MKWLVLLIVLVHVAQQVPSAQGKRSINLPTLTAQAIIRSGNHITNRCNARHVKISVDFIKFNNGKKYSIYQPSPNQRTFHPRWYYFKNVTRFDHCAHVAESRDALMFEIHDHHYCRISFFQYNRYKEKMPCKKDHVRHLYMLENANKKSMTKDGVCVLHDKSIIKKHHNVQYTSGCNKLKYDCKSRSGKAHVEGAVFETTTFGCIYRHHTSSGDFAQGRKFCKKLHARLFSPNSSKQTNAFLAYHRKVNAQSTYIGLRRRYKSHKWKWMNSKVMFLNNTSVWKPRYPDRDPHKSCAIVERHAGLIKNDVCSRKFRNVCYKEKKQLHAIIADVEKEQKEHEQHA